MRAIVDGSTMKLLEERAISSGQSAEQLMERVGEQLSAKIVELTEKMGASPTIVLLSGKGNNGADGYTALRLLQGRGFPTVAWQIGEVFPKTLLEKKRQSYIDAGGRCFSYPEIPQIKDPIIIIDGLYGLGFRGRADEASSRAILWANAHTGPVISIDISSGVDPSTGEVLGEAIYADYTFACQFPKRGSFLKGGWERAGEIVVAELPLEISRSDLYLMEETDISSLLPRKQRTQNKYTSGSVVAVAGSCGMMGAASLACEAAYTVGAGYVRLLLSRGLENSMGALPREVVKTVLSDHDDGSSWLQKADSSLIGPGLGRERESLLESFWPSIKGPAVIDADALTWLSKKNISDWRVQEKVLTPHIGELSRLLQKEIRTIDDALLQELRTLSCVTRATIVLKGAPTFLFSDSSPSLVMPRGNPGMATAGTGDVLTGMICGFLAQKLSPPHASMLATWLHGVAGEICARERTSYAVTASSLLSQVPGAVRDLLEEKRAGQTHVPFGRAE